jgi:uncharacterized RDD family membrane protein YckC
MRLFIALTAALTAISFILAVIAIGIGSRTFGGEAVLTFIAAMLSFFIYAAMAGKRMK